MAVAPRRRLPEAVSPAVDRGALNGADAPCELVDQRGAAGPLGAYCDIGAVESDDRIFADGLELADPAPAVRLQHGRFRRAA